MHPRGNRDTLCLYRAAGVLQARARGADVALARAGVRVAPLLQGAGRRLHHVKVHSLDELAQRHRDDATPIHAIANTPR